jgi:hypothetical protein
MKRQLSVLVLLAAACGYVQAQNDVYLCVDGFGKKEYKNTGITKGCRKIDLPSITMIPAPSRKSVMQTASAQSSSEFPRIDSDTQKARDNDRRRILLTEMQHEADKLASLQKEYNNGQPERQGNERNYAKYQERVAMMKDDISRAEKNIEALKREIGNLK